MPTIVREAGFDVRIYTSDHPPPHVHVEKAGAVVKIGLADGHVMRIAGAITDRDVKRAEHIVIKHTATLMKAWKELHGDDQDHG